MTSSSRPKNSPNVLSDKRQPIVFFTDLLWFQAEGQTLREEYLRKREDSKKRAYFPTPFPFSSNFLGSFFDGDSTQVPDLPPSFFVLPVPSRHYHNLLSSGECLLECFQTTYVKHAG